MTIKDLPPTIPVTEVLRYARALMPPEDIDHHGNGKGMDDLYLKVGPVSLEIVKRMEHKALISKFTSNIDGCLWYDLPFLYNGEGGAS